MSTTTENTNVIDEKKTADNGGDPDFKQFATSYLSSIIFTITILIFIIGTIGLYTCKIAQANILPDDVSLAPFTVIDRIVKDIPIDIHIVKPSIMANSDECFSQKAVFNSQEYLDSFNKSFLCNLKKNANPDFGMFANAPLFFSNVYDNLIAKNFLAVNTLFFYLGSLPENLVMLFYAIFGIFIWFGLYFFNLCISIFYHFVSIPQLFRTTTETEGNQSKWETNENISFLRFTKLILFFFIWCPVGLLSTFMSPFFFTAYGLIAPLFATYSIKQTNKPSCNLFDFIKDTFVYKKGFFFILATISLISNGIKYLGNNAIIGIAIAIAFSYFMGLYSNEMPTSGTDGFTAKIRDGIKQAEIKSQTTQLVEICQPIPAEDNKMDRIIQKGTFRKLSKKKIVGGETMGSETMGSETMGSETMGSDVVNTTPLTPVTQELEPLQSTTQKTEPSKQILKPPTVIKPQQNIPYKIAQTEPIKATTYTEPLSQSLDLTPVTPLEQLGGKKNRTKKFNMRLT